jgi:phosphoribosylformylglycinamidine synthase
MWKAEVYVTLKSGVVDPQGSTVQSILSANGFEELKDVRVGKFMELVLDVGSETRARARVEEMCETLLANPVLENYRFDVMEMDGGGEESE